MCLPKSCQNVSFCLEVRQIYHISDAVFTISVAALVTLVYIFMICSLCKYHSRKQSTLAHSSTRSKRTNDDKAVEKKLTIMAVLLSVCLGFFSIKSIFSIFTVPFMQSDIVELFYRFLYTFFNLSNSYMLLFCVSDLRDRIVKILCCSAILGRVNPEGSCHMEISAITSRVTHA